jgi:hypothetical protein
MPPNDQSAAELKRCIRACREGDQACITACEDAFVAAGGTVSAPEGGKVFTDPNGGKVFVTDGGKVF